MTLPLKSANESHNSNFLVRADGLAVRSLRTESPKASEWEFKAVGLAMKTNLQIDGSSAKNRRIVFLPSHFHIEPFKPLCTGHLKDVRENECPSRYPHILGRTYSHPKMVWGLENKKSEGDVRENGCPSRVLSPLCIGIWGLRCEQVRDISMFVVKTSY